MKTNFALDRRDRCGRILPERIFKKHMLKTKLIWQDGKLVDWDEAKIHVLTHGLHYGSAVFEGIRFYETDRGPAIFRLPEHNRRLFYSAKALHLKPPFSENEILKATIDVVAKSGLQSGYIRPLIFCGEKMGIPTIGAPIHAIIACWGWGKYLSEKPLKVNVSSFIRIHPKSTICDAKISGHYVNSILSSVESHEKGCDEALLLDFEGNIAEGPGENFFMVKDGKLFTPPLGNILAGITRESVIAIAQREFGLQIVEQQISLSQAQSADELFFTGTAAEISPIGTLEDVQIADGKTGPITRKLLAKFMEIVAGKDEKYLPWLTFAK